MNRTHETYETSQPWVTYVYGLTHDKWWPFWNSTRVLGRARIRMTCCVCGTVETPALRIPRFGPVPQPASGRHPAREAFLAAHAHPDRGHPMSWALPLLNPAANDGGLDLDLLAARLEADLNQTPKLLCPECAQGKPINCTGQALDPDTDEFVPCEGPDNKENQS